MNENRSERISFYKYFALFGTEIVLLSVAWLPRIMSLNLYAFCDQGSNLTVQYLVTHGYRPTIDFGYHYGLLAILSGQLWFGLFGLTPYTYQAAVFVCDLLMVMALAQIVVRLRVGPLGIVIMVVGLGFAVQATYPDLAQALEATLLCQALAAQTLGNKPKALAFTSAAVLAKPSMGYFYSLLLLILIALELRQHLSDRLRSWVRALAPATLTFGALLLIVTLDFGVLPLIHSLLPLTGMKAYREMHFGFFTGVGRRFWDRPGQPWFYYFVTASGFWIVATLYLIIAGLRALVRFFADGSVGASARDEIIITCALLHVTFVTLLFGNQWSWTYYSYLLILGVAVSADIGAFDRRVALPLCILAVLPWTARAALISRDWASREPSSVTANLWASSRERREWKHVLSLVNGHHTVVVDSRGAAGLLFPEFDPPVSLFLVPGVTTASEIQGKVSQMAHAGFLVVPFGSGACFKTPTVPELSKELSNFTPRWTGKFFEVLQRASDEPSSRNRTHETRSRNHSSFSANETSSRRLVHTPAVR